MLDVWSGSEELDVAEDEDDMVGAVGVAGAVGAVDALNTVDAKVS
jgi:hypothetical protein